MKRLVQIAAVLLVILAIAIGGIYLFFDANQFRPMLEAELTKVLGRQVKVGHLKLAVLKGSLSASDLSIADDPKFSQTPFVHAKSLDVGVELRPLIFDRKLHVTAVTIDQPEVAILQAAPGEWNFATIGSKTAPTAQTAAPSDTSKLDLSVKLIRITNGRVTVGKPRSAGPPKLFEKVDITVRDFSPAAAIPFTLTTDITGAHVKLDGKVGPFAETNAAHTPVEAAINVTNLDLSDSGFFAKSTGIDGLVTMDGTVNSTGVSVVTKGLVKAERLKLAKDGTPAKRTVEFDFTIGHNVAKQSGILSAGTIHIGKAQASITGDYSIEGDVPNIKMNLSGPKMAISELMEMLPPLGIVLPSGSSLQGGLAAVKVTAQGPLDRLTVIGPIGLSNTKLAGFDLGSKLKTIAAFAGVRISPDTEIQTLSAHIHHTTAGTDVTDLELLAPALAEITGAGSVTAAHELNFKMRAKLHTSGGVMAAIGARGDTTIPFSIRGTSSNPVFVPDVKGIAAAEATSLLNSTRINKALEGTGDVGKAAKSLLEGLLGGKKQ